MSLFQAAPCQSEAGKSWQTADTDHCPEVYHIQEIPGKAAAGICQNCILYGSAHLLPEDIRP